MSLAGWRGILAGVGANERFTHVVPEWNCFSFVVDVELRGSGAGGRRDGGAQRVRAVRRTGNPATFTLLGGAVEFGGQAFLNRPNNSISNNSAKFNQYGDREEPLFLSNFNFNAAALDGTTLISGMGSNVGTDAQAYELDVAQPGQDYFTYDWVSTPNLRSNNALTVFQGAGSNFTDRAERAGHLSEQWRRGLSGDGSDGGGRSQAARRSAHERRRS